MTPNIFSQRVILRRRLGMVFWTTGISKRRNSDMEPNTLIRQLQKTSGTEIGEAGRIQEWSILHNQERRDLYISSIFERVVKSRRLLRTERRVFSTNETDKICVQKSVKKEKQSGHLNT
jgi:hypothetical protein